jgi:hypothetical protein
MTITDKWLIERARIHKAAAHANSLPGGARRTLPPVDGLWEQLQKETQRQAAVYTGELRDPKALVVETSADAIELRTPDGRHMTVRVDRRDGSLTETFRNQAGATRTGRSILRFVTNAAGELTFGFGGLNGAAGSLVRRMICS